MQRLLFVFATMIGVAHAQMCLAEIAVAEGDCARASALCAESYANYAPFLGASSVKGFAAEMLVTAGTAVLRGRWDT